MHHLIWIISDDSHRQQQAIALAEALTYPFIIHSYSQITTDFIDTQTAPSIVIGAGKDTAEALSKIKQITSCYSVMILDPLQNHGLFDLIVLPDYEPHYCNNNVITIIGLLNKINPAIIVKHASAFISHLNPPYIAVLLGGDYIGGIYNNAELNRLASQLNTLAASLNASLLITTSTRTNERVKTAIITKLEAPYQLYDYRHDTAPNPYIPMLGLANAIVVTGDSIRMCSEACSSGKPVYIFEPNLDFKPYEALYKQLYEGNFATKLGDTQYYQPATQPLNEAQRVVDYIKLDIS